MREWGFYERARERLRRALAETPTPAEIRRLDEDARAAFENYRPPTRHALDRDDRAASVGPDDGGMRDGGTGAAYGGGYGAGGYGGPSGSGGYGGGGSMGYGGFGRRFGPEEEHWNERPFWARRGR